MAKLPPKVIPPKKEEPPKEDIPVIITNESLNPKRKVGTIRKGHSHGRKPKMPDDGLLAEEKVRVKSQEVAKYAAERASLRSNDDSKKLFLSHFKSNNCAIAKTCKQIGIDRTTYYNWMKDGSSFADEVGLVQDELLDWAENKLYDRIESGDLQAIMFLLKTKGKSRGYGEEKDNNNGVVTINVNIPKPEISQPTYIIQSQPTEEQKRIE